MALAGYGPLATDKPGLIDRDRRGPRSPAMCWSRRLKGVADRTAAEKLNGVELFVDRDKLPPTEDDDDFYHADLIGLEARLTDGTVLGKVIAVPNFGAGDLLEVRDPRSGDTYLYPFTKRRGAARSTSRTASSSSIRPSRPSSARRSRIELCRRRHHAVPRAVPRPARRLGDRPRHGRRPLVAAGPPSSAISPPTGTARSMTRRPAAAPAWC